MTIVDGAYWIVLIDYSIFKMTRKLNNVQHHIILYLLFTYYYCIYMFFLTMGYIDLK